MGVEGFLIGVSSIFWRESWKYGERAFRYCNHDAGHALACVSFSANLFGWKVTYLNALSDEEIKTVLGFNQIRFRELEEEHTDFLALVHRPISNHIPRDLPDQLIAKFAELPFVGEPDKLSQRMRKLGNHLSNGPPDRKARHARNQGKTGRSEIVHRRGQSLNRSGYHPPAQKCNRF